MTHPVRTKSAQLTHRAVSLVREPRRIVPGVRRRVVRLTRFGSPPPVEVMPRADRLALMTRDVDLTGLGLEIGPSHNPLLPKAAGYDVRIADYLDRDGLLEKFDRMRPTDNIEAVDYVLTGGRLTDEIPDRFDYIVASHVIEHTVCLVCFLEDCAGLLQSGGALTLAVPDKRYSFDRFRERTAIGRVIDTHRAGPVIHTEGSVIEHQLAYVRKDGKGAWWAGAPGPYQDFHRMADVVSRSEAAARGEYVDTHNWVFTPHHFRLLLHDLRSLGLVSLREKAFHDTVGPEFYVTLSLDGAGPAPTRAQLIERSAREAGVAEEIVFVPR